MRFAAALSFLASALALYSSSAYAQQTVLDSIHNASSLTGTWSSGSQNVVTGAGFANPANETFTTPKTTGISYSFTDDGWFESARYRFTSNGSQPGCIIGSLIWFHGHYQLLPNGSIVLVPLGDGYQQVQDPCAAQSTVIQNYNYTELYSSWRIFQDPVNGFKLHLFAQDGSPYAPQFQVSSSPNMLPQQMLRTVTPSFTNNNGYVSPSSKRRFRFARRLWH